jgi:hypothetical protein
MAERLRQNSYTFFLFVSICKRGLAMKVERSEMETDSDGDKLLLKKKKRKEKRNEMKRK